MDSNEVSSLPGAAVPEVDSVASSPRERLLRQITGGGNNHDGFIAQLSSNPFFTAVRTYIGFCLLEKSLRDIDDRRVLAWLP